MTLCHSPGLRITVLQFVTAVLYDSVVIGEDTAHFGALKP